MGVPNYPTTPHWAYPINRTPQWDTGQEQSVSGKRLRYPNQIIPSYQYELTYEYLLEDQAYLQWQTLFGFFNQMFGAAFMFRFNDESDNAATSELFGQTNGVDTQFQLTRAGNFGFAEPVFAPVTVTQIKRGATALMNGTDYTVNLDTGIVTFAAVGGEGNDLQWTGTYDWYARFDDDRNQFSKFAYKFWELKKITFTTEIL